jgi:recombination protein RecT
MTKQKDVKEMVENAPMIQESKPLGELLRRDDIQLRFKEVMGNKAGAFMSSILSAVNQNPNLKICEPMSVISSAMIAAVMDLPINQSLGFAHLVPYKNRAQFQMGWRGYVQLAIRTGQYKTIHTTEIYDGELLSYNRITGDIETDQDEKLSDKIIGYLAFFKLIGGFEKYLYMTVEEVEKHGKRYSRSYSSPEGKWKLDFDAMAKKTVLKMLLSKYGILSVDMQKAIIADQGIATSIENPTESIEYPDQTPTMTEETKPVIEKASIADIEIEFPGNPQEDEKKNATI